MLNKKIGGLPGAITILLLVCSGLVRAEEQKRVEVVPFSIPPEIDGRVIEDCWWQASPTEGFFQFEPHHGQLSPLRTIVYIGVDDQTLYVAFVCYDPAPEGIAAALTKRDSDLGDDDAVAIFLDTLDDDYTASAFVTNLLGTQWDFRITDNGRSS
ncbi:MAG: hypothetical protein KAT30_01060, partial [Candidatus Krumholzibacteria bacterium]|nr:hypothetical protein [Candidatus Krumholzibacteria bacterium]